MGKKEQFSLSEAPILQDEWEFAKPLFLIQGIKGQINILELGTGDMAFLYGMASILGYNNKIRNIVCIDFDNISEPGDDLYRTKNQVCETLYAESVNCYGIEAKTVKKDLQETITEIANNYHLIIIEPFNDRKLFEEESNKYIKLFSPSMIIFKGLDVKSWSYDIFKELSKGRSSFTFNAPESNYGVGGIFTK